MYIYLSRFDCVGLNRERERERKKRDLRPYNDNELKMLPLVKSVDERMLSKKMQTALFR